MQRPRPWLAAAFAALVPGLGHVYLRSWIRAGTWLSLALAAVLFVVPPETLSSVEVAEPAALPSTLAAVASELPRVGLAFLGLVVGCNVADAYTRAKRAALDAARAAGEAAPVCPHCGGELDDDIDFCHWCTAQLDEPVEA